MRMVQTIVRVANVAQRKSHRHTIARFTGTSPLSWFITITDDTTARKASYRLDNRFFAVHVAIRQG